MADLRDETAVTEALERTIDVLKDELGWREGQVAELLDALAGMVACHCYRDVEPAVLDSWGASDNSVAMRLLAKHNRFEIDSDDGRRVSGRLVRKP